MLIIINRNNRIFMEIVALLQQFPDLDKMLSGLTHQPKKVTQKTASTGIDTLIFLKQALKTAPALAGALQVSLRHPANSCMHAVGGLSLVKKVAASRR